jgi:ATP-binding cassette subfamily F protein uup
MPSADRPPSANRLSADFHPEGSEAPRRISTAPNSSIALKTPQKPAKNKLTFKETREFELMEQSIQQAEAKLQERLAALHDPEIAGDASKLRAASVELEQAQKSVDSLYARWAELESRMT